jgi:hypothetical protein
MYARRVAFRRVAPRFMVVSRFFNYFFPYFVLSMPFSPSFRRFFLICHLARYLHIIGVDEG